MSLARIRKAPCGSFKEYGNVGTKRAEASCKRSNRTESEIDTMASLPLVNDQHHFAQMSLMEMHLAALIVSHHAEACELINSFDVFHSSVRC